MILSLEVVQAKQGDCLILHYGNIDNPSVVLIDGGPAGVYKKHLKPRLSEIKHALVGDNQLPIELVMVSHADDDHINGILSMANDLVGQVEDHLPPMLDVKNFWFNSFDDIIGNDQVVAAVASLAAPSSHEAEGHIAATIASTGQGRDIRDKTQRLGWHVNEPFTSLAGAALPLVRADQNQSQVEFAGLKVRVVHPDETRLRELQTQWDLDLKKAKAKGDDTILLASMVSKDKSPFNLSSIVCLVEFMGKTILLTGDARSDDIYNGLKENNFLDNQGKLHVNILKMPHHGSKANMTVDFLQKVRADHYVISADGKHNNPDQDTLDMMLDNIEQGTLYLTNHDGDLGLKAKLDGFLAKLAVKRSGLKIVFRDVQKPSVVIDLIEKLPY